MHVGSGNEETAAVSDIESKINPEQAIALGTARVAYRQSGL